MGYSESECIGALHRATDRLGHPPSAREYQQLRGDRFEAPSYGVLYRRFGSWNAAKEAAGLSVVQKRDVDESYFETIASPERAYWLGFVFTDGHARVDGTEGGFHLHLSAKDCEHVKAFADAISSTHPVVTETRSDGYDISRISIPRRGFAQSLLDRGMGPNERGELLPKCPDQYTAPLLRGIFDADGYVATYDHRSPQLILVTSNPKRAQAYVNAFDTIGIQMNTHKRHGDDSRRASHVVNAGSVDTVSKVYDAFYPDGEGTTPCLDRKRRRIAKVVE